MSDSDVEVAVKRVTIPTSAGATHEMRKKAWNESWVYAHTHHSVQC